MFSASDILLFVIAFAVLWVAAFICWFLWQIARVVKGINDVLRTLQDQASRVEQGFEFLKTKLEHGTGHLGNMADHVREAVKNWSDKRP